MDVLELIELLSVILLHLNQRQHAVVEQVSTFLRHDLSDVVHVDCGLSRFCGVVGVKGGDSVKSADDAFSGTGRKL